MDEFITILLEQIRCKRAREGIAKEIMDHIEDATQALEGQGMTHEKALASAVESMGDPVEICKGLLLGAYSRLFSIIFWSISRYYQ